ncbi:acyl thioesterase [Fusarium heterosporum]|uniref:Acyl thioesterase n=1 Tax=Fusarium heterosporum TaxID=42747 RepID=A0A8H5SZQ7_FUSHE|nr:acyl thioesterase [Fusarium heterosporum]
MAPTLADQVAVDQVGDGEYVSRLDPIRMGNASPIAYGGCTAGVAANAACRTAPPNMSLYSLLGHFHGPASTVKKLHCSVTNIRDTRSFATRRVQVKQQQPNGEFRVCMELLADFHVKEPETLEFSAATCSAWPRPEDCPDLDKLIVELREKGSVTEKQGKAFATSFGANADFFETRYCTDGVSAQNLAGAAKDTVTTQDDRHITEKVSAEWQRALGPLETSVDNMSALAFLMDGGLSFLPLSHNHMWFDDTAACSTLDFALRIFVPEVKMSDWHLRERKTSRAGGNRSYSEGKLWDQYGNLIASNTQQSIMRIRDGVSVPKL